MIPPLHWLDDESAVSLLDQTALPEQENWLRIETPEAMAIAIRSLAVRGAPAIGIAAAFGVALALRDQEERPARELLEHVSGSIDLLAATRPTAVNLFYALERMRQVLDEWEGGGFEGGTALLRARLLKEAQSIFAEDQDAGKRLGEFGIELLGDASTIITHCHTGGVATSGYGTALAPIILAKERGRPLRAFVDETRPLLQGSRITAWELMKAGVDATLITDSMAAHVMQQGLVDEWEGGGFEGGTALLRARLLKEAQSIFAEDQDAGKRLGEFGIELLGDASTIITHCHTGGVATSGYGTALAPIILAKERGRPLRAFVDETRPLLQGSRITAWELMKAGVDATLITDSMAAHVMQQGLVDAVIVGADRIAANGDVANKIGTYGLAVLANAHGIPFYVSAPVSTIDLGTASGQDIVIEERDAEEVRRGFGKLTAPAGVDVYNPAFDVTPAELVDAIITERGVIRAPYGQSLRMVCESTLPARASA